MQPRTPKEAHLHRLIEDKEEKEALLLEYIQKHEGETMNKIAKKMEQMEVMSRLTTIKKIDELKERKILIDEKEKHSYHRLYINQDNEFNKIFATLLELETFIDKFSEELPKIEKLHDILRDMPKDSSREELFKLVIGLQHSFLIPYFNIVKSSIHLLISKTIRVIDSEESAQILYNKSFKLLQILELQNWNLVANEESLGKKIAEDLSSHFSRYGKLGYLQTYPKYAEKAKSKNINVDLLDELMETLKRIFSPEP